MDYGKLLSTQIGAVSAISKQAELLATRVSLFPQNILGSSIVSSLEKINHSFGALNLATALAEAHKTKFDFTAVTSIQSSNMAIASLMKTESLAVAISGMNKSPWIDEITKVSANITKSHDAIRDLIMAGSRPFQVELGISKLLELKVKGSLVDSFAIQTALSKVSAYTFQAEKSLLNVNALMRGQSEISLD